MIELKEALFTEKEVELYTKAYEMLEAASISGAVEGVELERLKEELDIIDYQIGENNKSRVKGLWYIRRLIRAMRDAVDKDGQDWLEYTRKMNKENNK